MADVFISHVQADRAQARQIATGLTSLGFDVAWDAPTGAGETGRLAIDRALDAAKAVIVVWTPNSQGSARLHAEALAAKRAGKLVQIRFNGAQPPLDLRGAASPDLSQWDGRDADTQWQRAVTRVKRAIARQDGLGRSGPSLAKTQVWLEAAAGKVAAVLAISGLAVAMIAGVVWLGAYWHGYSDGYDHSVELAPGASDGKAWTVLDLVEETGVCHKTQAAEGGAEDDAVLINPLNMLSLEAVEAKAVGGDLEAQYALAIRLYDGLEPPDNVMRSLEWFRRAAEGGKAEAQFDLGTLYADGTMIEQDMVEAAHWFIRAARQGHADAQYNMGVLHMLGEGAAQDEAAALDWFEKAAAQDQLDALYNLGAIYTNGIGVRPDHKRAAGYLERAAKAGLAEAQYGFGLLLQAGDGVERDPVAATAWFREAAQQSHPDALFRMAAAYAQGDGVTPSAVVSSVWYTLSKEAGVTDDGLAQDLNETLSDRERGLVRLAARHAASCLKEIPAE